MTETTTAADATSAIKNPLNSSRMLLNLIGTLLAPMFRGVTAGDIGFAHIAALETDDAYRARNHIDLIAAMQIICFSPAALGSLCLSMDDDVTKSMMVRLRGDANACDRWAEQNRRALAKSRSADQQPRQASRPAKPDTPRAKYSPEPGSHPEPAALPGPAA